MEQTEITICSVYHSLESKHLLELNWRLTRALNPNVNFIWLVADNTPLGFIDVIDNSKFSVVPGIKADMVPTAVQPGTKGSYHHSMAVNESLKHITTRFAIFLDIDFYVIKPDWITDVLAWMRQNDLAFFGVPWHPKKYIKVRYFPAHHFLAVDGSKVNIRALDFRPGYEAVSSLRRLSFRNRLARRVRKIAAKFLPVGATKVGTSRDTSYRIFDRYKNDHTIRFEILQPVFKPATHNNFWQKFLPDSMSVIPKKKGYFSSRGFADLGYFDGGAEGWEEFLWHGQPFGFHLRGSHKLKEDLVGGLDCIKKALNSFINNNNLE